MAWRDFQKIDFKIKKIFMGKFKQFKKAVKYFSEQYPEEPITFRDLLLVMEASERIIKEEGGEKEDVEEEAFRKDGEVIKEKYELPDAEDKPKVRKTGRFEVKKSDVKDFGEEDFKKVCEEKGGIGFIRFLFPSFRRFMYMGRECVLVEENEDTYILDLVRNDPNDCITIENAQS